MRCLVGVTAQKIKFSIKDFFNKCDQTPRKLGNQSLRLKKYLMENFIFCAVSEFWDDQDISTGSPYVAIFFLFDISQNSKNGLILIKQHLISQLLQTKPIVYQILRAENLGLTGSEILMKKLAAP